MTDAEVGTLAEAVRFIEAIFGPLGSHAGVSGGDITAAEGRLGASLPQALKELYLRTGHVTALHAAHNTLVPLDQVGFEDDHLVFYEENQGVVAWGVARSRLSEADPPVDQGQPPHGDADRWAFYPEFASISEFVCAQAAWQTVQGGLPFVGTTQSFARVSLLTDVLGAPSLECVGMRAWLLDRGVVVDAGNGMASLATSEAESFVTASARLGMTVEAWDYATLRRNGPV